MRTRPRQPARRATSPETGGSASPLPRIITTLVLFAVIFFALQVVRSTRQSATWDEPMHLTAGYAALANGDFRVDPSHPPLARLWAALPLAVSQPSLDTSVIDRTPAGEWLTRGYAFARDFVSREDVHPLLLQARAMTALWGVILGVFVFAWMYEWMGMRAAALALVLYTLSPNLSAHSALVTTDAAVTTLMFGAVYFLWRYSRQATAWDLAGIAVCTALAAVTKFSAVLLAPVLAVLLVVMVVRRTIRPQQAALVIAASAGATVLAIWAVYGFRYAPSPDPQWLLTRGSFDGVAAIPLGSVFEWIDRHHLLPNAFTQGFVYSLGSARELPAFLAGEVRPGGWWYYFPAAMAFKTPLAILALAVAGIVLARGTRAGAPGLALFLLIPASVWLGVAATSGVNLGVRHVLPVYPFLTVAAAIAAELLLRRPRGRLLVAAAVACAAIEVGRSEPYPLSFFNTLAGGPANGFRYLADSNLGWGGALKALKGWMDDQGVSTINLAYFGSIDPATYGVQAVYLPSSATFLTERFARPRLPGYVAISGTTLDGVFLPPWWRHFYAGFRDREPVAVVANSMRVYWVDRWPDPPPQAALDTDSLRTLADGLLFGLHWPEQALVHYDDYVRRNPGDPGGWNAMSLALAQTGRRDEALAGFRRVLALSPSDPDVRRNIALLEQQVRVASARPR